MVGGDVAAKMLSILLDCARTHCVLGQSAQYNPGWGRGGGRGCVTATKCFFTTFPNPPSAHYTVSRSQCRRQEEHKTRQQHRHVPVLGAGAGHQLCFQLCLPVHARTGTPTGTGHCCPLQDHVPLLPTLFPTLFHSDTAGSSPHVNKKHTTVYSRAGPAPLDGVQATVAARWRHPHRVHPRGVHIASPTSPCKMSIVIMMSILMLI